MIFEYLTWFSLMLCVGAWLVILAKAFVDSRWGWDWDDYCMFLMRVPVAIILVWILFTVLAAVIFEPSLFNCKTC